MPLASTADELDLTITAILADSVAAEGGKLYVQGGGWDSVTVAPVFPVQIPRLGIGIIVHVPYSQTNRPHELAIQLQDEDGAVMQLADGPQGPQSAVRAMLNVGRPPQLQGGQGQNVVLAANLDSLSFSGPGTYDISISVNDQVKSRLPFRILTPPVFQ